MPFHNYTDRDLRETVEKWNDHTDVRQCDAFGHDPWPPSYGPTLSGEVFVEILARLRAIEEAVGIRPT